MKIELLREIDIAPALYGLGLSYGKTKQLSYPEFNVALRSLLSNTYDDTIPTEHDRIARDMLIRADKNAEMDGGHNKFLESITVDILITAPRFFWVEFDTYRVGVTKQSDSTMHTIMKDTQDLGDLIPKDSVYRSEEINSEHRLSIERVDLFYKQFKSFCDDIKGLGISATWKKQMIKHCLPEGFESTRQIVTNYKALRNIYKQRVNHELPHWRFDFAQFIEKLPYSHWIIG